jgi:hypothetical protein
MNNNNTEIFKYWRLFFYITWVSLILVTYKSLSLKAELSDANRDNTVLIGKLKQYQSSKTSDRATYLPPRS